MKLFSRIFIGMLLVAVVGVTGGTIVYGQNADSTGTVTTTADPADTETTEPSSGATNSGDTADTTTTTKIDNGGLFTNSPTEPDDPGVVSTDLDTTTVVNEPGDTTPPDEDTEVITLTNEETVDESIDPVEELAPVTEEEEEEITFQRKSLEDRDNIASELLDDSDGDGLTDFDEINIYNTDPNDPNTGGGPYNDGEDVRRGLDPLSAGVKAVLYEDPRTTRGATSAKYTVDEIVVVETEVDDQGVEVAKTVAIRGTAQPKAFVTVYIFSNPVVVTVQADGNGKWEYHLEKRLDDGEHIAYAAAVNNSGKILLKSEGTEFSKRAAAVNLNSSFVADAIDEADGGIKGFFQKNFIWIAGAIIILALLLAVLLSGIGGRKRDMEVTSTEEPKPSSDDDTPEIGNIV